MYTCWLCWISNLMYSRQGHGNLIDSPYWMVRVLPPWAGGRRMEKLASAIRDAIITLARGVSLFITGVLIAVNARGAELFEVALWNDCSKRNAPEWVPPKSLLISRKTFGPAYCSASGSPNHDREFSYSINTFYTNTPQLHRLWDSINKNNFECICK